MSNIATGADSTPAMLSSRPDTERFQRDASAKNNPITPSLLLEFSILFSLLEHSITAVALELDCATLELDAMLLLDFALLELDFALLLDTTLLELVGVTGELLFGSLSVAPA